METIIKIETSIVSLEFGLRAEDFNETLNFLKANIFMTQLRGLTNKRTVSKPSSVLLILLNSRITTE